MARPIVHTKRIEVRLKETSLDALKRATTKLNISNSEFIREAIDNRLYALKMNSKEQ